MNDKISQAASHEARFAKGAFFGLAAVCVWATWISITRLGVTTSLSVYDLTMLRFATAGILLAPVVIRKGWALDRLGWPRLLVLVSGAGAPYVIVASSGLRFAPAAHAGALMPGVMPLFVALLAALLLKEKFSARRKVGYALIAVGVFAIIGATALAVKGDQTEGHLLFLTAAFMWACYAIVLRQSQLDLLHAAALVAAGSCIFVLALLFCDPGRACVRRAAPRPRIPGDVSGRCRVYPRPVFLWQGHYAARSFCRRGVQRFDASLGGASGHPDPGRSSGVKGLVRDSRRIGGGVPRQRRIRSAMAQRVPEQSPPRLARSLTKIANRSRHGAASNRATAPVRA